MTENLSISSPILNDIGVIEDEKITTVSINPFQIYLRNISQEAKNEMKE